jgi:hypothetical protein
VSLQALPGISPTVREFVASVRAYLRDYEELNRLVAGVESSDRQIAWAAMDALAEFNGTPHFTRFSIDELLDGYQQHSLLRRMTVCTLIESVALLQTRNHVNYSNGGLNLGVNDKTPMLMNWLQYYKASTSQKMQQVKVAINISSILGTVGLHSELWSVNSSYAAYL